jgi:prevent-host-death family protein
MEVSVYAAKARLSALLDRAVAGEEVVITRHGRPIARLVPAVQTPARRKLGALRGKIRIAEGFDAPLPADLLDLFEGKPDR